MIPSEFRYKKIPSYIGFPNKSYSDDDEESDEPIFGDWAKNEAYDNPHFTIFEVKRMLGRKFNDHQIQSDMRCWPFSIQNDGQEIKVKTGPNTTHTPLELTTLLVKYLKELADKYVNEEVVNAVVTVPAYFDAWQRELTKEACNSAGLNVLQMINEPTAAAVAYKIHRMPIEINQSNNKCLIFYFGGSTLDVTVLSMNLNKIKVLAIGGDVYLGGQDIDNNMVEYCIKKFKDQHRVDLKFGMNSTDEEVVEKTRKILRRLTRQCKETKERLSETKRVQICVESIHNSFDLVVPMNRNRFNEINKEYFERCLERVDEVLKDAKLEPKSVDDVVLLGGSSQIPKVQEMLSDYFQGKRLFRSIDPEEAVAIGAAMLAFEKKDVEIPNVILQELQFYDTEMDFSLDKVEPPLFKTKEETGYPNSIKPPKSEVKADTISDLAEFAKIQYRSKMETITATPKFVEENDLRERHHDAVHSTIETLSLIKPLSLEQKQNVKLDLDKRLKLVRKLNLKKKNSPAPAIGIDLGTTFFCMAVFRNPQDPEIIPNDLGNNKTPSYVAFPNGSCFDDDDDDDDEEEEEDDDAPIFGETAKMMAHDNPIFTIFDVKRMLGRKFNDSRIQHDMQFWPFHVLNEGQEIKVKTGPNTMHSPLELTTLLVKHLKEMADKFVNDNVVNAVITVPAYFDARQKEMTKEACNLAGLNVLQMINEPTAAAVAYQIHKKNQKQSDYKCLIFDFGGGTFDLSLLTINMDKIYVLAVGGNLHLGGGDIDNKMVEYCIEEFRKQHGVDLKLGKHSENEVVAFKTARRLRRLKLECERQKKFLSQAESVVISLDAIHESTALVVPMKREIFNKINQSLFEDCLKGVEGVLKEAKLDRHSVDDVVLVGGSSRIPKVQEMLSDYFGEERLRRSIDLDEAVAVGAARLALQTENVEIANVFVQEPQFA